MARKRDDDGLKIAATNRRARFEYEILETWEAGLVLQGTEVKALEVLWKTLWSGGAPEREVTLDIVRRGQPQTLKLQSVDRMKTLKSAQGI